MLWRVAICAFALAASVPASAGARVGYHAEADSLALLMQDDRAISSSVSQTPVLPPELRAFRIRDLVTTIVDSGPRAADLAGFDELRSSMLIPARFTPEVGRSGPPILLSNFAEVRSGWIGIDSVDAATAYGGGRYAVGEALAIGRRDYRHSALEGMLEVNLNGEKEMPQLSLTGGVAAVFWQVLPKN